jgi:acylphosphatase
MGRLNGAPGLRFHVHGVVQGVGFRWFVRDAAVRLGVRGWVQNEPDGTVSGVAEGGPDALESFLSALRSGPAASRVDAVHTGPCEPTGDDGFEIRR